MAGVNVDIKPNPQALEVISYLAYETVAQVIIAIKTEKHIAQPNTWALTNLACDALQKYWF